MKAQQPVTLEVECPSCQKPFTITDAQAGSKHSCPHCQQHVELEPAEETQTKEQPVSPPVKTTDVSLKVLLGVVSVVLVIGLLAVVVGMLYAKNRVLTGRLHRLDGRMDGNNALVQLDVGPKPGFYIADNGDDLQVIIITEYGTLKRAGFQWKYETRAGNVLVSSPFGVTAYKMETDSLVDGKDVYKLDENGSKRKQIPAPGKYVALVIYNKNNKVDENYGFGSRSVTMEPVTYTEEELYGLTMIFKLTRNCLVNEDLLDSTKTTWRLDKDSTLERRFRRLSRNLTELAQSERYSWNDTHIAVAARRIVDPRTSCGDASTLVDDLNEEIEKIIASLR